MTSLLTFLCAPRLKNFKPFVFTILLLGTALFAQAQNTDRSIRVKYISSPITLDGVLDEAEWQLADKGGDFWQFFPSDKEKAMNNTEFQLLYDDHTLYI